MPIDAKYGRITVENEPGNPLGDDEPVVLFRARDVTLPALLLAYEKQCNTYGSPPEHMAAIGELMRTVCIWQDDHPDLVKVPD